MAQRQISTRSLTAGDSWHLAARRGGVLYVVTGSVVLRGPMRWLAECMVVPEQILEEGASVALTEDGWVAVSSSRGAEIRLQEAPLGARRWPRLPWREWLHRGTEFAPVRGGGEGPRAE